MDAMQILILAAVGVAVLLFFRSPYANDPVKLHNPEHAPQDAFKLLLALLTLGGGLYAVAMYFGMGSTSGYENAVAAGRGDLFLFILAGVMLLIALANEGIMTKILWPVILIIIAVTTVWRV
jgi:hypothetical protein